MNTTIAAISTAVSASGIGIIRISGPEAMDVISRIYRSKGGKKKIKEVSTHTIHYGYIYDEEEVVDEVLIMVMRAPKTFTGEDTVEIDCHGGVYAMNRILETVLKNGAKIAEPGEFTKRAFLNGRLDLSQAEAVMDVIQAKNEYALKSSMSQLKGSVQKSIREIRDDLIYEIAFIESALDDPEHISLDGYPQKLLEIVEKEKKSIEELLKTSADGKIIREGIETVIVGKPNAGKSSLLNLLVGENKAIVTDISGTTRDIVEGSINYKGILFNFIDTAGIRETCDVVEKIGVEKSKSMIEKADYTILVLNYNETLNEEEKGLLKQIGDIPSLVFINKIDLENKLGNITTNKKIIYGSTVSKKGIEELKETILEDFAIEDLSQKDLTYLSNTRQISLAKQAMQKIENVIKANEEDVPVDMLAIDIKSAWEDLGKIIGEYYEEELVDNIFQRFCLGK